MAKKNSIYEQLLLEINEEVNEGGLTLKNTIQILRDSKPIFQDYCPIIDWYYDALTMEEELSVSLEEMYLPEEFSKEEWQEMKEEQEAYKKQYEADQPNLLAMSVKDVLTEMKQIQKLL
ncbi:MAG: hypothetical protein Q4E53_01985 [Eubacteriales bacterium]|nr:hypothetical protein [Eubacteriales bacterium]